MTIASPHIGRGLSACCRAIWCTMVAAVMATGLLAHAQENRTELAPEHIGDFDSFLAQCRESLGSDVVQRALDRLKVRRPDVEPLEIVRRGWSLMPEGADIRLLALASEALLEQRTAPQGATFPDLPQLIAALLPDVVTITTFDVKGSAVSQGTGFVCAPGVIVTNCHILHGSTYAVAKTQAGQEYKCGYVLRASFADDIAFVAATQPSVLRGHSTFSISPILPRIGEEVIVIGSPMGLELSATSGIVSAIRDGDGLAPSIQISAAVSRGSSGSPLFTRSGNLVGVVTSKMAGGELLGFAASSLALLGDYESLPPLHGGSGVDTIDGFCTSASAKDRFWASTYYLDYLGASRQAELFAWYPEPPKLADARASLEASVRCWREALRIQCGNADDWDGLARALNELQDVPGALAAIQEAIHLSPAPPALQWFPRPPKEIWKALSPDEEELFKEMSKQLFADEDERAKHEAFQRVWVAEQYASRYDLFARLWWQNEVVSKGATHANLGPAIVASRQAVKLIEDNAGKVLSYTRLECVTTLVLLLQADGQGGAALGVAKDEMDKSPGGGAYRLVGDCYLELGDYARAVAAFQESSRLEPNEWRGHYGHAVALWRMGKRSEALQQCELGMAKANDDKDKAFITLLMGEIQGR